MRINPVSVAKFIVSGAVGIGTSKIVKKVIESNVSAPDKLFDRITMLASTTVITAIFVDQTKQYSDKMIDDVVDAGTKIVEEFKLRAALGRINRSESTFEEEKLDSDNFHRDQNNKWVPNKPVEKTENDNHQTTNTSNVS